MQRTEFWSYVNQTAKVKPGVSMLERKDGTVIENDVGIAKNTQLLFCSVLQEKISMIYSYPPYHLEFLVSPFQTYK